MEYMVQQDSNKLNTVLYI